MAIPDDDDGFREQLGPDDFETIRSTPAPPKSGGLNEWLLVVTFVLLLAVSLALAYAIHTQHRAQRLVTANGQLAAELTQTQTRLNALTDRFNKLSTPAPPAFPADETFAPPAEQGGASLKGPRTGGSTIQRRRDSSLSRMQRQLSAEQLRITNAEQAIAKTRADMASNVDSTRNNLSNLGGSVARDHSELVALEKQGQRNYYEFDLFKSKRFEREGPISLELRHTDTKHDNYDLELLINDSKLTKKHVNLYQPLVFQTSVSPQPLELVVNRIDKNHIHGYVSAPKSYAERASAAPPPPEPQLSLTPAPAPVVATPVRSTAQASPELTLSHQP